MKQETFKNYLQRLKDRRTEDNYKYTDYDLEKYRDYIFDCYTTNLSVYKCLEWMSFAEREIKAEDVFNDQKKEGLKEFIDKHKQECMITKNMQMDAEMAYNSLPKKETLSGFEEGHKANLDWLEQNSNQTKQETLEEAAEKIAELVFQKMVAKQVEWDAQNGQIYYESGKNSNSIKIPF